jgi:hypothetical protein
MSPRVVKIVVRIVAKTAEKTVAKTAAKIVTRIAGKTALSTIAAARAMPITIDRTTKAARGTDSVATSKIANS